MDKLMAFKYPHLTRGYVGQAEISGIEKLTLNSTFYSKLLLDDKKFSQERVVFPQRIPREDFFSEICTLEKRPAVAMLIHKKNQFYKNVLVTNRDSLNEENKGKTFLNGLHLLLRYGSFREVEFIAKNLKIRDSNIKLEVALIASIARSQSLIAEGKAIQALSLVALGEEAIRTSELEPRILILVLNYIIVATYRFGAKLSYEKHIKKYTNILLELIASQPQKNFGDTLRSSIAYRGLAMIGEFSFSKKEKFLGISEVLARNLLPTHEIEDVLMKENLFTYLQTASKWNIFLNRDDKVKACLEEMMVLDPYDSVAYGESAFFLLNQGLLEEAKFHFEKAANLGPPGVAMHTYYYAKCLEELGEKKEAFYFLQKSAKLDKKSITPLLDLTEIYLNNNEISQAKKLVKKILHSRLYKEQLDVEEIVRLEQILN